MEQDELLHLIDKDNNVVGTVMREEHHDNVEKYNARGQYWRGVACFVINDQNQVWVPRRQPWRKVARDGLDFSMAEHVMAIPANEEDELPFHETHLEGAIRGMREELTLDVQEQDLEKICEKLFLEFGCLMWIYTYRSNDEPDYSREDYQSAEWMTVDELITKLENPEEKFKSGLPEGAKALKRFLANS